MLSTHATRALAFLATCALFTAGCGDDGPKNTCSVDEPGSCAGDQVCEVTEGGTFDCFDPVHVRGLVFDAADDSGIGSATVLALDANGAARTTVVKTAADGSYSLPVAMTRMADGTPIAESVLLRVGAQDYLPFPDPPRSALPIELSMASAQLVDGALVVNNSATDVALLPQLSVAPAQLRGRVDIDPAGGFLVVAEQGDRAVSTAVSDLEGEFTLFNVPAGETTVRAYRAGHNVTPEQVTATDGVVDDIVLGDSGDPLSAVSGSVNIVNAPGGLLTSVILVLESTFNEALVLGQTPSGLRAGEVDSAFRIENVPSGNYVVLAAYENDELVRDPDTSIGGTEIVRVTVSSSVAEFPLRDAFKVTEALDVVTPGGDGYEVIGDLTPVLVWEDDSSEDGYELRIYDAYGNVVVEELNIERVTGATMVSYSVGDGVLEEGGAYQFRVLSFKNTNDGRTYISSTEDLKGVFLIDR